MRTTALGHLFVISVFIILPTKWASVFDLHIILNIQPVSGHPKLFYIKLFQHDSCIGVT